MKKLISILLCSAILFSCFAFSVSAENTADNSAESDGYPVIIVSGMKFNKGLIYDQGTENEKYVGVNFSFSGLVSVLSSVCGSLIKGNKEEAMSSVIDYAYTLFEGYACDSSGESLHSNISVENFPESVDNYDLFYEVTAKGEKTLSRTAMERYGKGKVYFMYYDWRLDPEYNSEILNGYIEKALAENNAPKVNLIVCSMGGIVTLTYMTNHGSDKINTMVSASSTLYGTDVATDLFLGDYRFEAGALERYLKKLVPSLSPLLSLLGKTGILKSLCNTVTKLAGKYETEIYDKVLRPVFGTMPAFWALCQPDKYEEAKHYIFDGYEQEYAEVIKKADRLQYEVVAHREETLQAALDGGMKLYILAGYNTANVSAYKHAGLQGDNILETRWMSMGALVSEVGSTLSEEDLATGDSAYVSADKCINASTCEYPEYTWFIKNGLHVGGIYGSDYSSFIFTLLDTEVQEDIHSFSSYPQFMSADKNENLSVLKAEENGVFAPVC